MKTDSMFKVSRRFLPSWTVGGVMVGWLSLTVVATPVSAASSVVAEPVSEVSLVAAPVSETSSVVTAPVSEANPVVEKRQQQKQKEEVQELAAQELADLLKSVQTIKASFQQDTLDNSGRRLQGSSGSMVLKRPDKFRWTVEESFPQVVVSDGQQVSYYDQDMEQVTLQSLNQASTATPAMLLSGNLQEMLRSFSVAVSVSDGRQMFTLTPKESDSPFQELYLTFEKGVMIRMVLIDSLGSRTNIQFSNVVMNDAVQDKLFKLDIPPDVDVLDQRVINKKGAA